MNKAGGRTATTYPQVTVSPSLNFGQPTINGIATATIAEMYDAGGADEVLNEYDITLHELLVALWYEGNHGRPKHRKLWRTWARKEAAIKLWNVTQIHNAGLQLPPRSCK